MDEIRTVEVEFLRPGPAHNQLLSPLTQYLAVCGEAGAGTVSMPFEQAAFNRRLADLRYTDDDEQDQTRRLETLRTVGTSLGEVLGAVPGLIGSLTEDAGSRTMTNLRIMSSASELATLPFELSKMPSGLGRPSDEWLALRAGAPICITRRERSVYPSLVPWAVEPPRVLFVVGLEIDKDLEASHRAALTSALAPWRKENPPPWSDYEPLIQLGGHDPGTGEKHARPSTVTEIREALLGGTTLVHILAHGAESETTEGDRFGLLLKGNGEDYVGDIVTGERLASVLRSLPADTDLPSTFVVASCDSAYQADVLVPGGSFARALHVAGVPLVIASQFPLTEEGSRLLAEMFYGHLFWGENPLPAIAAIRARLHAEYSLAHDWASLVVYDALPDDLDSQLENVRFTRARRAVDTELDELEMADPSNAVQFRDLFEKAYAAGEQWLAHMPDSPRFELAVADRRGSFAKRMAEYAWANAEIGWAVYLLKDAHRLYSHAARRLTRSDVSSHYTSMHWLQTQAIALSYVLGIWPEDGAWTTARRAAELDLAVDDLPTRMWAHGTLAELWLLRMFLPLEHEDSHAYFQALHHADAIVDDFSAESSVQRWSTWKQFLRYSWWGDEGMAEALGKDRDERWPRVREVAKELAGILHPEA